jgi:PKHD-type hydroxylase
MVDFQDPELSIEDIYGGHGVKLPADDPIPFPSHSLRQVIHMRHGARLISLSRLRRLMRDHAECGMLFAFDATTNKFLRGLANHMAPVSLISISHNHSRQSEA